MISITTLARELKISESCLMSRIKKYMGDFPDVYSEEFRSKVLKEFKERPYKISSGKTHPDAEKHYLMARAIIERDGFISSAELIEIFNNNKIYNIINTFDRYYDPLYKDTVVIVHPGWRSITRGIKVYRFLSSVHDIWKKEARQKPNKNGYIRNEARVF